MGKRPRHKVIGTGKVRSLLTVIRFRGTQAIFNLHILIVYTMCIYNIMCFANGQPVRSFANSHRVEYYVGARNLVRTVYARWCPKNTKFVR